jgi:catechol 2,3-dioxygenase-like lactoylglutathione lyase family enzyme
MSTQYPRMHVSLYVSNLAQTVSFYQSFFDIAPAKIKSGYAKFELASPPLIISFVENRSRVRSNFGHLGIQLETPEKLQLHLERARKLNIVTKEEIGTACCYAVQDKFWAADPDGHQWEMYYFHEDVEFNDPHYTNAETEACCASTELNTESSAKNTKEIVSSCTEKSGCC